MKLFLPVAFTVFLIACNQGDKKDQPQTTPEVKALTTPVDEKAQKIESLKKLTPADLEKLHAILGEELNDMKRTSFSSSSTMGYAFAEGMYQKGKKNVQVLIYDCAGEAGAILYIDTYSSKLDVYQEDSLSYLRTIDLDGKRAIENYKKDAEILTLTFMYDDRTLIVMSGKNIDSQELREDAIMLYRRR